MPWHYWAVGLFALVWNLLGVLNAGLSLGMAETVYTDPEQLAYIQGMPVTAKLTLVLAVTTGIAGAVTFFMRKRVTVPLWLTSVVMIVLSSLQDIIFGGVEVFGAGQVLISAAVLIAVQSALLLYARGQVRAGSFAQ